MGFKGYSKHWTSSWDVSAVSTLSLLFFFKLNYTHTLSDLQLSHQNKDLASLLKPSASAESDEMHGDSALEYYAKHTAQIEVNNPKEIQQDCFILPTKKFSVKRQKWSRNALLLLYFAFWLVLWTLTTFSTNQTQNLNQSWLRRPPDFRH